MKLLFKDDGAIIALLAASNISVGAIERAISISEPYLKFLVLLSQVIIGLITAAYAWKKFRALKGPKK